MTEEKSKAYAEGKPKRVRRSLKKQLAQALRDAEAAATADISTQKLIQTRLTILNKALSRQRIDKTRELKAEVLRLISENERLRVEIAAKSASRPMSDIEVAIAKYEAERMNDANTF